MAARCRARSHAKRSFSLAAASASSSSMAWARPLYRISRSRWSRLTSSEMKRTPINLPGVDVVNVDMFLCSVRTAGLVAASSDGWSSSWK